MIIVIHLCKFVLFEWVLCLHICLCITWVPSPWSQKMLSDTLGLELQTIEIHCRWWDLNLGFSKEQPVLLWPQNHLSDPHGPFFDISVDTFLCNFCENVIFLKRYSLFFFLANLSSMEWKNSLLCTVDMKWYFLPGQPLDNMFKHLKNISGSGSSNSTCRNLPLGNDLRCQGLRVWV